jgi:cyclic beta-1,2-glucan synthetase
MDTMQTLPLRLQNWVTDLARVLPSVGEPPLRAELFSVEQLSRHARTLAANHQVVTRQGSNSLLARLTKNEDILRTFNRATLGVKQGRRITPAAEWLLDNFYLIEEQIQMAKRHLPRGYSRELPRLLNGPSAGLPRVYDIVLELISHVDAQIDAGPLSAFIAAYQTVHSLKLGELWAIPIMLRLGLIENLQRVSTRLTLARADRDLADLWVNRLQEMAEKNPSHLVIVVADMAKSDLTLSSSFVAEFCQRLSRQSPVLHLARGWLEQRLGQQGLSIEQLVQLDSQNQAADQVSVSHSITSLRFLSAMDWKEFVESLSLVETTLLADPADVYSLMDFATRDRYRHSGRVSGPALQTVRSGSRAARHPTGRRQRPAKWRPRPDRPCWFPSHRQRPAPVGAKIKSPLAVADHHGTKHPPVSTGFLRRRNWPAHAAGHVGFVRQSLALELQGWKLIFFTLVFLLCASQLAVALMNWLSTLLVKPSLLPRMDYSAGIPEDCRTMVVVPTMLSSVAGVDRLIETLEIHHLANRDEHLHFALLTDFRDAPTEILPGDEILLQRARVGIELLNRKYFPTVRIFFSCFIARAAGTPAKRLVDGLRTQAGKAHGIQCPAPARRCARLFF